MNVFTTLSHRFATAKQIPLLAGLCTVAIVASTVVPSLAQSTPPASPTTTQHQHKAHKYKSLNLTTDQKAQLKTLRQSTKTQMDSILTTDQKAQLKAAHANHQKAKLNLTDAQKAQIKQVRATAKQQRDAILTPAQLQQLQQMRQHHKQPNT